MSGRGFLDTDDRELMDRMQAGDDLVGAARAWVAGLSENEREHAIGTKRVLIDGVIAFERVLSEQKARRCR